MRPNAPAADIFPLLSVLVVDPDLDTRELYALMLSDIANDIEGVDDGRIALARVLAHPPSLLVTETHVPFIDGYTLCQLMRRDPATANVPIVIATGDGSPVTSLRARAAGADAVLVKPVLIEHFVNTIRQAVEPRFGLKSESSGEPGDARSRPAFSHLEEARRRKSRALPRYATSMPPRIPPPLRCPSCDRPLKYLHSHIGGVNANNAEQWDHFECSGRCGVFEYRHRTKKLNRSA